MIEKTTITIVGPTGVGKTSLLASMYSHMKTELLSYDCSFTASARCGAELDERMQELELLATGEGLRVDLDLGPRPGSEKNTFDFELNILQKNVDPVPIEFIDLPGGWYTGEGDFNEADRCILDSQVVIVAVDAWALMEVKNEKGIGKYNNKINRPKVICEALERASNKASEGNPKPLVLFVLGKAEKYLHHGQYKELLDTARACYEPLMNPLVANGFAIAACCVETVGGIELLSVKEATRTDGASYPVGSFKRLKDGPHAGYNPKGCSTPLRLVFDIALSSISQATLIDWIITIGTGGLCNCLKKKEWLEIAEKVTEKLNNDPIIWLNKP